MSKFKFAIGESLKQGNITFEVEDRDIILKKPHYYLRCQFLSGWVSETELKKYKFKIVQ